MNNEQTLSTANQCKKAYDKPQLQVYGDLRDITRTAGAFSFKLDGAFAFKTH